MGTESCDQGHVYLMKSQDPSVLLVDLDPVVVRSKLVKGWFQMTFFPPVTRIASNLLLPDRLCRRIILQNVHEDSGRQGTLFDVFIASLRDHSPARTILWTGVFVVRFQSHRHIIAPTLVICSSCS